MKHTRATPANQPRSKSRYTRRHRKVFLLERWMACELVWRKPFFTEFYRKLRETRYVSDAETAALLSATRTAFYRATLSKPPQVILLRDYTRKRGRNKLRRMRLSWPMPSDPIPFPDLPDGERATTPTPKA